MSQERAPGSGGTGNSHRLRTVWGSRRSAPLRAFLATESGSAGVLVLAVAVALAWANLAPDSYTSFWATGTSVRVGSAELSLDLRDWLNSGLMTLFFLVVGLEARREFDLGDLRDRRRVLLPVLVGLVAMAVPALIFVAVNAGESSVRGWGVAMSTDTALALGALALLGPVVPSRVRVFLLTVFVVDDVAALVVIATVYSHDIRLGWVAVAVVLFGGYLALRSSGVTNGVPFALIGVLIWVALYVSGVDPLVAGLLIGLSAPAYAPPRPRLEEAVQQVRQFREQPTAGLARTARARLASTLSPNARLQQLFHPWTSYVIVPLFALANTGIALDPSFLAHAYAQPVTIGVLAGYLLGKPVAVLGTTWVITRLSRGRLQPPVGWAAVAGSGTISGVGFTVALLIAGRAFAGDELQQATLGALTAAVLASVVTWVVYRITALLPPARRQRALQGNPRFIADLYPPVDPDRDHIRGSMTAPVTIVEYGDFECPHCGEAEPALRRMLADEGVDARYVWRHLPLTDVHPHAQAAAEASEAAAAQGAFWEMHDLLLDRQTDFASLDVAELARRLGLDVERFTADLDSGRFAARVARHVESADLSGVAGTPTFFVDGQRHEGPYDLAGLTAAVEAARLRALRTR